MLKNYFKLKVWKIITLLAMFSYGLSQMRGPQCMGEGIGPCIYPLWVKIIVYASSVILPGTTQLFRDNGFLINHKTYAAMDGIPQLIFHVGIDIFYWYLIICFATFIADTLKKKLKNS